MVTLDETIKNLISYSKNLNHDDLVTAVKYIQDIESDNSDESRANLFSILYKLKDSNIGLQIIISNKVSLDTYESLDNNIQFITEINKNTNILDKSFLKAVYNNEKSATSITNLGDNFWQYNMFFALQLNDIHLATIKLYTKTIMDISYEEKEPDTYNFLRDGVNTVNYTGQTTRIAMAKEIHNAFSDSTITKDKLLNMYKNENNKFSTDSLNKSGKSIYSKLGNKFR